MFKRKSAQQNNPPPQQAPVAPSAGRPSISSVASSAQPHAGIGDRVMSFNSIETTGSSNTVKNRRMSNFLGLGGKKKDKGKEREDQVSPTRKRGADGRYGGLGIAEGSRLRWKCPYLQPSARCTRNDNAARTALVQRCPLSRPCARASAVDRA